MISRKSSSPRFWFSTSEPSLLSGVMGLAETKSAISVRTSFDRAHPFVSRIFGKRVEWVSKFSKSVIMSSAEVFANILFSAINYFAFFCSGNKRIVMFIMRSQFHKLKILKSVIQFIVIFVMDNLVSRKLYSGVFFINKPMFKNILAADIYTPVAIKINRSFSHFSKWLRQIASSKFTVVMLLAKEFGRSNIFAVFYRAFNVSVFPDTFNFHTYNHITKVFNRKEYNIL